MAGGKIALLTAGLALGACADTPSKLTIKPVGQSAADMLRSGDGLAVARAQLLLNNVGLALEEYRKVQLQRPGDPAPLAGIADCYAAMGRFDLAQSNYESALALAPRDPRLLLGLAQIFELQGDANRAAGARAEAQSAIPHVAQRAPAPVVAQASAPTATAVIAKVSAPVSAPKPIVAVGSLTVELPAARPVMVSSEAAQRALQQHSAVHIAVATGSITVALPPARPVQVQAAAVVPVVQLPITQATAVPVQAPVQAALRAPSAPLMKNAVLAADIPLPVFAATAPLLPHLARHTKLLPAALTIKLSPAPPAPAPAVPHAASPVVGASGPRLQRLSTGEVALVTGHGARNAPLAVEPQAPQKRVQWIALNGASTGIQVLNAARREGLAASARTVLLRRGWHGIAVANAGHVVEHSYVLYPRGRSGLARRLAAQFAIRTRGIARGRSIVLVLGRDRLGLARAQRQA